MVGGAQLLSGALPTHGVVGGYQTRKSLPNRCVWVLKVSSCPYWGIVYVAHASVEEKASIVPMPKMSSASKIWTRG